MIKNFLKRKFILKQAIKIMMKIIWALLTHGDYYFTIFYPPEDQLTE